MPHPASSFIDLPIRIHYFDCSALDRWRHADLAAPYWRLYRQMTPGWEIRFDDRTIPLRRDRLYLIPPETHFATDSSHRATQWFLHFLAGFPYDRVPPNVYETTLTPAWRAATDEMITLAEDDSPIPRTRHAIDLALRALALVPQAHLRVDAFDPRIQTAIDLIESNLESPPSSTTLARAARLNTNAFTRLFKSQTGLTPQQFSRRARIQQACLLPHHTNHSIDTIAAQTGFADRHHFSRIFKQSRKLPPAAYRALAK